MSEPCNVHPGTPLDPAAVSRMPVPNLCAYCCVEFVAHGYGLQARYSDERGEYRDQLSSLMAARQAWARGQRIFTVYGSEVGLYPDTQVAGSLVCAQHAATAIEALAGRKR